MRKTNGLDERTLLKRISIRPGVCGGRPCIRGHRIPVETILGLAAAGITPRVICTDWYPSLTQQDVYAAIAYATRLVRREAPSATRR